MTVRILILEMPFCRAHVIGTDFIESKRCFMCMKGQKYQLKVFKNSINTFIQEPIGKK